MKIISIVGARPNFMKIAPIVHEIKKYAETEHLLIHTGQHYDPNLSEIFFEELGIPRPDINLGIGGGTREDQILRIKEKFNPVLERENPDLVIVVGDVNSTIACAEAAREKNIKVAHIEAGLRSGDLSMPEEINRIATDKISDYLFITEKSAIENLKKEGIEEAKIHFVGNVMIDTLIKNLEKSKDSGILSKLRLKKKDFIIATIHRPSNVDKKEDILKILDIFNEIQKKIEIVIPLHPRTKNSLEKFDLMGNLRSMKNLLLTEPLGYLNFLDLVSNSRFVLTDSGGIQEETTYLKIPCITMRPSTERPSTITEGTNVLVGNDKEKVLENFTKIIDGSFKEGKIPELWDGKAAERIVKILNI
ncbi:UDP-N-acetylglucosamine 2-epimerase (non-hydrolyzing) [Candidatus Woesearchaeota archaeon]|nr:UDP-N-acetylglucosamine 2-epimerase (non-hydrolyzing) [Candidatus Woesearchaeota archaeon]